MSLLGSLDGSGALVTALGFSGKACAASAFSVAYLYPTELFPTAIRGQAPE
jgi:hypothetical protein